MTSNPQEECRRLSQQRFLKWVCQEFPPTEMFPVCRHTGHAKSSVAIHCALVPNAKLEGALKTPTWDMRDTDGMPGAVEYWNTGKRKVVEYLRHGNDQGFEPLVIWREFHGIRSPYAEISEEFRLFHNLYFDAKSNSYTKIDDAGNETEVVTIKSDQVCVRLKEIKQFLAVKEMHLAIYFDNREYSLMDLDRLGLQATGKDVRDGLITYGLHWGDLRTSPNWKGFSRLLGKRLMAPFPKEKSGFWGFAEAQPDPCADFVVGVDDNGEEILNTSDENQLADNFGGNPGAFHYLTPVFFRKAVLDKYYQQPQKYSVEDGYLGCGRLWGMAMDNHHDEYVVAWLGDLGRDLPSSEQLHWKSYNVAPCGGVSEVFFRRQICGQFTDTNQPDLKLKYSFPSFVKKCAERLGWPLFLPLALEDKHYFNSLRIPASNDQKEFDELVQGLAKVLVDSLNEKELVKFIPNGQRDGLKGSISRLEAVLASQDAQDYGEHIQFLRDLQDLRSSGSAHRKGKKYEKAAARFAAR